MVIQQEVYQAKYVIDGMGPNNFDLAVKFCHPHGDGDFPMVTFGITREDGQKSWLGVLLTGLKDIGERRSALTPRNEWAFEGIRGIQRVSR